MALQTKTLEQSGPRGYKLQLILNEESISIANNTSSMSYTLRLVSTTYSFAGFGIGWSVTVNGTVVSSQARTGAPQRSISANSTLDIVTGTIPSDTVAAIAHNTDGTKTITAEASIDMGTTTSDGRVVAPGPIPIAEDSMVLTAIPRASTFTVSSSNRTLGVGQTITIKPYVSSYTHTVTYSCGNATGTIASGIHGSTSGFSQSWTPSINTFAPQNKTGTSVNITISVETFYNNVSVGTNSTTVTFAIPASVTPSISSIGTSCPQGHVTTYGGYVQGKSTCSVSVTASGSQGSTITGYSVTVGTAQTFTSSSFTTGVLTEAGNAISITATVTDSRNRTATNTVTIKVYEYSSPKITKISLKRTDSSGTATESGTYGTVTFTASVSSLGNHNTAQYTLKYKVSSASSYSSSALTTYNNNYSVDNGTARFSNANVSNAYSAYITVQDAFSTVSSATDTMPSASAYFKADPENNAFSFGKLETAADTFQSAWKAVFDQNVDLKGRLWSYGDIYSGITSTSDGRYIHVRNSNGAVSLAIGNNKGVYDDDRSNGDTNGRWLIYRGTDGVTHLPGMDVFYYGTCDTAAATQAKTATVSSNFRLVAGTSIRVKFTNAQTYNGQPTLNVNGTGDIGIVRNGTTASAQYYWPAGTVIDFVYDGTNWIRISGNYATTTYYGMTKLSSSTSSTSTSLAATPSAVKAAYDLATAAVPKAGSRVLVWSNTSGATSGNWSNFTNYSSYLMIGTVESAGTYCSVEMPSERFINTTTAANGMPVQIASESSYFSFYLYYSGTTGYFSKKGATSSTYGKMYYIYGIY